MVMLWDPDPRSPGTHRATRRPRSFRKCDVVYRPFVIQPAAALCHPKARASGRRPGKKHALRWQSTQRGRTSGPRDAVAGHKDLNYSSFGEQTRMITDREGSNRMITAVSLAFRGRREARKSSRAR